MCRAVPALRQAAIGLSSSRSTTERAVAGKSQVLIGHCAVRGSYRRLTRSGYGRRHRSVVQSPGALRYWTGCRSWRAGSGSWTKPPIQPFAPSRIAGGFAVNPTSFRWGLGPDLQSQPAPATWRHASAQEHCWGQAQDGSHLRSLPSTTNYPKGPKGQLLVNANDAHLTFIGIHELRRLFLRIKLNSVARTSTSAKWRWSSDRSPTTSADSSSWWHEPRASTVHRVGS
jgi:hypothetical protein